jgi:hypothetical protein
MLDPDDRISGRGQRALRKAGIATELFPHDLMTEVEELNRDFVRDRESRENDMPVPQPPTTTPSYNANLVPDFGKPDVALRFVERVTPTLVIVNTSDSLAREIKWTVVLWNMDRPDEINPLPIPVQTFDWLRPHTSSAMLDLFGGPAVAQPRKQGDRLFGSASVICQTVEEVEPMSYSSHAAKAVGIPKYQRFYSWQKKQREDLFGDIRELARKGEDRHHFMATIVCFRTHDLKSVGSLE